MGVLRLWRVAGLAAALLFRIAGESRAFDDSDVLTGVEGQSLKVARTSPLDPKVVLIGTSDGLFVTQDVEEGEFERIKGFPKEKCMVTELTLDGPVSRAATERGIFVVDWKTLEARSIFIRLDPSQRATMSVRRFGLSLFVASRGGLFMGDVQGRAWSKIQGPWQQEEIVLLEAMGNNMFAATETGLYRTSENGKRWSKILDVGSSAEQVETNEADDVEMSSGARIISMSAGPMVLFVATSSGIRQTTDGGATWKDIPSAGCDVVALRRIYFDEPDKTIYALTGSGVYAFRGDRWTRLLSTGFGREIFRCGERIRILTERGICDLEVLSGKEDARTVDEPAVHLADHFENEPTVQEVQAMAIAYAEVDNKKIKDWRRRAGTKALLPDLDVSYDKTVYGSSSGAFATGPLDWGISLSWDLGDLIYSSDQTSIDTRSKLMVELRNDILAEVTRLYFERRKMQMELVRLGSASSKPDRELKLQETTALIDRLTGGHYSKVLKSMGN